MQKKLHIIVEKRAILLFYIAIGGIVFVGYSYNNFYVLEFTKNSLIHISNIEKWRSKYVWFKIKRR